MEITTIIWRSGPDQWDNALTESCMKDLAKSAKLPMPLSLDFEKDSKPLGEVKAIRWSTEDKSLYATVEINPESERKFLGFNFEDSLRPGFAYGTKHQSYNTVHMVIDKAWLQVVSACVATEPARLPDPYVLYR